MSDETILRKLYPSKPRAVIAKALPHLKWGAIQMRAYRLGLKRSSLAMSQEAGKCDEEIMSYQCTPEEWAYLAGIIDGEGSITLSKHRRKKKHGVAIAYSGQVSIGNTSLRLRRWLEQRFPGRIYDLKNSKSQAFVRSKKKRYCWALGGMKACRLLLINIVNYLVIKKPQAELLIHGYTHLNERERAALHASMKLLARDS